MSQPTYETDLTMPGAPPGPGAATGNSGRGGGRAGRVWRKAPSRGATLAAHGQPMVWLAGGMLAICVAMIIGLVVLVTVRGMATFWPGPMVSFVLADGKVVSGEITRTGSYQPRPELIAALPAAFQAGAEKMLAANAGISHRELVRSGNFELDGDHFNWVSDFTVAERHYPPWGVVVERLTWGRFYGEPREFLIDGESVAATPEAAWAKYRQYHREVRDRWQQRRHLEKKGLGKVNHAQERARLQVRAAELVVQQARIEHGSGSPPYLAAREELARRQAIYAEADLGFAAEYEKIRQQINALNRENDRYQMRFVTYDGHEKMTRPQNLWVAAL